MEQDTPLTSTTVFTPKTIDTLTGIANRSTEFTNQDTMIGTIGTTGKTTGKEKEQLTGSSTLLTQDTTPTQDNHQDKHSVTTSPPLTTQLTSETNLLTTTASMEQTRQIIITINHNTTRN